MIRQHQFYKVELVSITTPEQSETEHERMVDCAEAVLKRLELPFRTVLLCDRRHGLLGAQDLRHRGLAAVAGDRTARSAPARTAATSRPGAWTPAAAAPARRARASSTP